MTRKAKKGTGQATSSAQADSHASAGSTSTSDTAPKPGLVKFVARKSAVPVKSFFAGTPETVASTSTSPASPPAATLVPPAQEFVPSHAYQPHNSYAFLPAHARHASSPVQPPVAYQPYNPIPSFPPLGFQHPGLPPFVPGYQFPLSPPESVVPLPSPQAVQVPIAASGRLHERYVGKICPLPNSPVPQGRITLPGDRSFAEQREREDSVHANHSRNNSSRFQLLPPRTASNGGAVSPFSTASSLPSPTSPTTSNPIFIEHHRQDSVVNFRNPFNVYAEQFVPDYLKKIQSQNLTYEPIAPPPMFPPVSYTQSFIPPFLRSDIAQPDEDENFHPFADPRPNVDRIRPVSTENYYDHWKTLLTVDLEQHVEDKEKLVLWKYESVKIIDFDESRFELEVPGVRENYPRLEVGDLVHMRQVFIETQMGSGWAFEAVVIAMKKRQNLIYIECPSLKNYIQNQKVYIIPGSRRNSGDRLPLAFNISFLTSARMTLNRLVAAYVSDQELSRPDSLLKCWLFPTVEDAILPGVRSVQPGKSVDLNSIKEEDWFDKELNAEQRHAVACLMLTLSNIPYLLKGPPGTGKTKTIAEAVRQILRTQPDANILLCAPSNSATDTLVEQLHSYISPREMLRLSDENRPFNAVSGKVMIYCSHEDGKFTVPPWPELMRKRVVACSCQDAGILFRAKCTNDILSYMADSMRSGVNPGQEHPPIQPHWTHLIVDEAAQASEPEVLIPISVVASGSLYKPPPGSARRLPQLILCGDPHQLGPLIISRKAQEHELDMSLLERLLDRPVYTDHEFARMMLVKNYRSHPAILMPPSAMFYDDALQPCAKNGRILWSGMPNPDIPVMFCGVESEDKSYDERASWFNMGEINKIAEIVASLLRERDRCDPPLQPKEIGIMAPWRNQVWELREKLREGAMRDVDTGTVEDYQGREKRVIIISCVRSNPKFLDEDARKGHGITADPKRMNVAISRARELLIIVGNAETLYRDPHWRHYLGFIMRNKLYTGPKTSIEPDENYISRLESNFFADSALMDSELEMLITVGGVAREALRE